MVTNLNLQLLPLIDSKSINIDNVSVKICNCIIDEINLVGENCAAHIEISNCIIGKLNIYGAWFEGGLSLIDNIMLSPINYQAGGHNLKPIELRGNIFHGFVSFFDCHFDDRVIVENNIFIEGSDILTKESESFDNIFPNGIVIDGNVGRLNVV